MQEYQDKPLSTENHEFVVRWSIRNATILVTSGFFLLLSIYSDFSIGISLNWLYILISVTMLITLSGISEQFGNIDWAKKRLYMVYVYNSFAMYITSIMVLFNLVGVNILSVLSALFAVYVIQGIVMDFHRKLDSLQKQ